MTDKMIEQMSDETLLDQINAYDPYDVEFSRRFWAQKDRILADEQALKKANEVIKAYWALVEALEAENARQTHELKKLWVALSTYENKVQEYASDDWTRSDPAYDWLNEDAGKTARAALEVNDGMATD